ncbi:MAG: ribonuclease J, partial [Denitrobacterium sp.]|nr:ribonuclease J [Denitrobacterium sp.]
MEKQKSESSQAPRRPKQSQSFKHVEIDAERPKLTPEDNAPKKKPRRRGNRGHGGQKVLPAEKDAKATLKVIPLGGLDAIGKNMTVFECNGDLVLDDAGLMFPDDDHPGIDLILPDYTYVLENCDKLRGIVITHGHEDHTGSLPYLLKDLDMQVPIYGTKMTLGLIEGKLAEHKIKNAKLVEIQPGQRIKMGCFTCDFFAVNHSIPGSVGVFFQTPAGNVLHTGDFKLDQTPIDGVTTDFGALARFSK